MNHGRLDAANARGHVARHAEEGVLKEHGISRVERGAGGRTWSMAQGIRQCTLRLPAPRTVSKLLLKLGAAWIAV